MGLPTAREGRKTVRRILDALGPYAEKHPKAQIEAKRQNNVSVRIRIKDSDFEGMDRVERDSLIWQYLDSLPEEVTSEITLLLLLTPDEARKSLANVEFEHPVPSGL